MNHHFREAEKLAREALIDIQPGLPVVLAQEKIARAQIHMILGEIEERRGPEPWCR